MPEDTPPKRNVADLNIDDPVELEITRNSLVGICEEMGVAMLRTSYSTMFNEARDFSCVVFDAQGEMIAQGDFCPAHIGAIVHTVEWAIKEVGPDNMHPGDVILHNDPYRGGCHLPEFMTLKPCFYQGEVVAYAANIAHMTDIGGMVPAAFGDTRNIFQEGLRLPPIKIYRDDQPVEDIFAIITSNVRTPKVSRGDLMAMVGSTYLAERRIVGLVERVGVERFRQLASQTKDVSEVLMRQAIERLPDGEYVAEGFLEDDGVIPDRPWKIRATVVIRGDEIIVDYTGSDPQAAGAINQSFGTTASATYAGIFHMIDIAIPWNHGAYRPIAIVAPPGSIVNVNYPGSCVGGNSDTYPTTVDILLAAFAQASDRSSAADGGTCGLLGFYGTNIDTGEPFVILHHEGMGWGGRRDADGNDAQIVKNGNCLNAPVRGVGDALSGAAGRVFAGRRRRGCGRLSRRPRRATHLDLPLADHGERASQPHVQPALGAPRRDRRRDDSAALPTRRCDRVADGPGDVRHDLRREILECRARARRSDLVAYARRGRLRRSVRARSGAGA